MLADAGLYVHFPWCVKKCPYCDFNSHPIKADTQQEDYAHALLDDWHGQTNRPVEPFASVFFGGGTPSLFQPGYIADLLRAIKLKSAAEVTIEANPGTHEYVNFTQYLDAGINRLSLGAQSFNDSHLSALGRIHTAAETDAAFAKAREAGFANINVDIMWGLPGQSVDEATADLTHAIELQPEHISWYQLTIEPKTEFAKRPPLLPVEASLLEIEGTGFELLARHGFERYEVSAYAKGGYQCSHNKNYWEFGDYMGLGAGAHGKLTLGNGHIERTTKASQPRLYLNDPTKTSHSMVDDSAKALEFMMNGLRLIDGVSWSVFEARTGIAKTDINATWHDLIALGLVEPARCQTTDLGLRYLDTILARFMAD
jgi:putative oxygen-independent coproporphyrinogen III oxidase